MKRNSYGAIAGVFFLICALADVRAQDYDDDEPPPWLKILPRLRLDFCDRGMTSVDGPKGSDAEPVVVKRGQTAKGKPLEYYSDGSTKEFHGDGVIIDTKPNGTKIESILNDTQGNKTTVVLWPSGNGFIRYADGTGSRIAPDGTISATPGTLEVLPDGVVRVTLKDEDAILDHQPDGSVKSRPDVVKEMKEAGTWTISQSSGSTPGVPRGQVLIESAILERVSLCNNSVLDTLLRADAQTAGVPRPIATVAVVEERKPGLFESLVPALIPIPSIGIGGGRGRDSESDRRDRERR